MGIIWDAFRFCDLARFEPRENVVKAEVFIPLYNDSDYGFIADYPDRVIVCIRGTRGLSDDRNLRAWHDNFDPFPMYGGFVHGKFHDEATEFFRPVKDYLTTNVSPSKPVTCLGHSRGAAVSKELRRLLGHLGIWTVNAWGFGEPMHGTHEYALRQAELPGWCRRSVNGYDIVATTDLSLLGCEHSCEETQHFPQPIWHHILQRIGDHRYESYAKSIFRWEEAGKPQS